MAKALEPEAVLYTCERCKRSITLYIRASVTCSRCGKEMRQVKAVEKEH